MVTNDSMQLKEGGVSWKLAMHSSTLSSLPSTEELTTQDSRDEQTAVLKSRDARREQGHASPCAPSQWWHVNKGGFPIPRDTWEQMWKHVTDMHPNGADVAESIRGKSLKRVPCPTAPTVSTSSCPSAEQLLLAVQTYLQELQYNHTGTQFFEIRKNRPLSRLMETAKEIIHESLPIKCLEAVVVALYLTAPLVSMQRIAVSFKSKSGDLYLRHIVLVVHHGGNYGALGLSRREDLMYKPLVFKSLLELIQDFIQCYQQYHHKVVKVKFSSPIVHDVHSCEQIKWKFLSINLTRTPEEDFRRALEKFSRSVRTMQ